MRLTELDPRWASSASGRNGMGVTFACPVHRDRFCRLAVWFANPVDGGPAYEAAQHRWQRTGDTFETLTLAPSIHVLDLGVTHWHGFITAGDVT